MKIPQDVIIQLSDKGNWILFNVFAQTTVAVDDEVMRVLGSVSKGTSQDELKNKFKNEKFSVWEIGTFSNYEGLMSDPTRRIRDHKKWPEPLSLNIQQLLEKLEKNYFIISDEDKYKTIFGLKTSLLDKEHLGNFHQQLGQVLMIEKRENPSEWWVKQKFTPDFNGLNNNLYKAIQGNFLDSFFNRFKKSHKVLDIGCGVGYYTKLMGKNGATVLGIDPNEKYIEIAKKNAPENVSFKKSDIGNAGSLDWLEPNSFDFVFMSDALLFYFVSPDPKQKQDINILFSDIKRVLKKGGRFFSMEPNGTFWLRPWLGEEERPFTILTEYSNKRFNVAPNSRELLSSFISGGFILRDIKEVGVDENFSKTNKRATNFTKEFPLWSVFELEPQNQ